MATCQTCAGSGTVTQATRCRDCAGLGRVFWLPYAPPTSFPVVTVHYRALRPSEVDVNDDDVGDCPNCDGTGIDSGPWTCRECGGSGYMNQVGCERT